MQDIRPLHNPEYNQIVKSVMRADALLAGQRKVLQLLAEGAPLFKVLHLLVSLIEEQYEGSLCSILLVDENAKTFKAGVDVSHSKNYSLEATGVSILPPYTGPCFVASDLNEVVIAEDIGFCSLSCQNSEKVVGLWDQIRLEQVVTNLITNAIRDGGPGPIHVSFSAANGIARIVVRDQGPGIDSSEQEKIFQRYERGSSKEFTGKNGLGLGLHIVREIVSAHGGTVRVQSALGQGAQFIVELPLKPAAQMGSSPHAETYLM